MNTTATMEKSELSEKLDNILIEEPKKTCVVCGDKALGYNFNAITCESCKAFFRRNALKKKVFKCRFSGDCDITIASRRYCQKCRLKKCFQVGMMPELITVHPANQDDPHEKCSSSSLIRKRQSQDAPFFEPPSKFYPPPTQSFFFTPSYSFPPQLPLTHQVYVDTPEPRESVPPTPMTSIDQNDYNLPSVSSTILNDSSHQTKIENIDEGPSDPLVPLPKSVLMHLINLCHRGAHDHVTSDTCPRDLSPMNCVCRCICGAGTGMLQDSNEIDPDEEGTSTDIGTEVKTEPEKETIQPRRQSSNWAVQVFDDIDKVVTTADKDTSTALDLFHSGPVVEFPPDIDIWKLFRLEELLSANEILAPPRQIAGPLVSYAEPGLAAHMMDLAIRRTLDMLKCIGSFCDLSPFDQIALFKGGIRELMCLRGLMVYDSAANSYRPVGYPHRFLRLDAMRSTKDGNGILRNFYNSFHADWRKCDPIMLCLTSMVVFDPTRPNVTDVVAVRSQQQFYQDLLKCYLRTKHTPTEAAEVFNKLIDRLNALKHNLNRIGMPGIHIEMSSRDLEPLLIDILPLSNF